MDSTNILFAQQVDINASLDGAQADVGLTYAVPEVYASYITVSSTGVVTPIALPPENIAGVIVLIKKVSTGAEVGKVVLVVRENEVGDLVVGIVPVASGYTTSGLVIEYRASKAKSGIAPGNNTDPTSSWEDLAGGNNDGSLLNFSYNASSGWDGDGTSGNFYRLSIPTHGYTAGNPPVVLASDVTGFNLTEGEMEFWVVMNNPVGGGGLFQTNLVVSNPAFGINGANWIYFGTHVNGPNLWFRIMGASGFPNGQDVTYPAASIPSGTLVMLSAAWSQTEDKMCIYKDGVEVASIAYSAANWPSVAPTNLAFGYGHGYTLNGDLFQVRVYDRKLTNAERLANFNAGVI